MATVTKTQKTVIDISTMQEIKIGKEKTFVPITAPSEALERLGNDQAKLLKVINDGLKAEERRLLASNNDEPWRSFTDDGKTLNGPFTGEMLDSEKVGGLVLQFAKLGGYGKDKTPDQKRAIKAKAEETVKRLIQADPDMRAQVTVSFADDEDDTDDSTENGTNGESAPIT